MKVLITGASGFIGRALLPMLAHHDCITPSRADGALPLDLNDLDRVLALFEQEQPDALVHLAWEGIPDFSKAMCERNYQQHMNLFEAIRHTDCRRVVITGTCMEYHGLSGAVNEAQVGTSLDHFGETKLRIYAHAQQQLADRLLFWARPFYVYGPGQRAGSLIPGLLTAIAAGERPEIKNPQAAQDFVHVGDVARGLANMLETTAQSGCYNLGQGRLIRVQQIADWLYALWHDLPLTDPKASQTGMFADLTRLRTTFNWAPDTKMREALRAWVDYVKNH